MRFGVWRKRIGGRVHAIWSEQGYEDQPPTTLTTLCNRRFGVSVEKFTNSAMRSLDQLAEEFQSEQVCKTCARLFH
jgi:hypothetical protein